MTRDVLFGCRRWWLAGLALAGVVLTHALAYRIAIPEPAAREAVLHDTGHGAWTFVGGLGLAGLVVGLAGFATRSLATAEPRRRVTALTARRLVVLQAVGFVGLELIERVTTGHHELSTLTVAPILLGLVVQVVVATLGALVLGLVGAAVQLLRGRRRRPRWHPTASAAFAALWVPRPRLAAAGCSSRGPPPRL